MNKTWEDLLRERDIEIESLRTRIAAFEDENQRLRVVIREVPEHYIPTERIFDDGVESIHDILSKHGVNYD